MPVSHGASCGMGGQVVPQPFLLGGPRAAAADIGAIAVQGEDVPPRQFITVVTLPGFARGRTEVLEIRPRALGVILVVAGSRPGAVLKTAPGGGIALLEVLIGAVRATRIACRENCSR